MDTAPALPMRGKSLEIQFAVKLILCEGIGMNSELKEKKETLRKFIEGRKNWTKFKKTIKKR